MKPYTRKRAARNRECREWRRQLIRDVDRCEVCGCCPQYRLMAWGQRIVLAVHGIARGPNRHKALDKAHSVLVVCQMCHDGPFASKKEWPEARQLAALRRSRPGDYGLAAYNELVGRGPDRITQEEVDAWTLKDSSSFTRPT
jgi:hypothetical protein